MVAQSPRTSGRFGAVVVSLLAISAASAATLLLGAIALHLSAGLGRGVALGLAVASAALFAFALPLSLDRWVTNAYRKLDARAASTWRQTALLWNGALIAFAVLAAPKTSRAALESQGGWILGGSSTKELRWLARRIPRSEAAVPGLRPEPSAGQPIAAASASSAPAKTSTTAAPSAPPPAPAPTTPDQPQTPEQVFTLRSAAVVVIAVRGAIAEGSPFASFFADLGIRETPSSGSGFIVSDDGLIITNHHVIDGANSAEITLNDGRRFDQVTVELSDSRHDLALLRVEAKGLPRAPLASDERVVPGARAIAIGNPLGLEFSVTDGIVSNTRSISGTTFLQMQTAIAPGSSGGPLFDDRGRVIGVNTATRGAGMNLAVFVRHVHELMAAPRSPRKLAPYPVQARIKAVQINDAEASSLDLMQIEEALSLFALAGEGCVHEVPANAELSLSYAVGGQTGLPRGEPTTSSNLGEPALKCLNRAIDLFGRMLAVVLVHSYPAKITKGEGIELEFSLEGLPLPSADAGAHDARPIRVRLRVGRPEK
ncbi:MAG TPA: trypsin-like peptidase domain-containing protein [Polyangiaceae bacterium]|nr:trypsin-like peptidase domain-containing protein [Polyangiaceae bacterium]